MLPDPQSGICQHLLAALNFEPDSSRLGLFGGTFDPIHRAHVTVAREVQEVLNLDHICLIPSAHPPHKNQAAVADAAHRMAMVRLAIAGEPSWRVSDLELQRPGPSYTIDTVRQFRSCLGAETRIFLIVGMDAFMEIDTWFTFKKIFHHCELVVMSRPQSNGVGATEMPAQMAQFLKTIIDTGYRRDPQGPHLRYTHPHQLRPVYYCPVTALDVSSTRVRRSIQERPWQVDELDPAVVAYIHQKRLYQ